MLVMLPLFAFLAICLNLYLIHRDFRTTFMLAALTWSMLLTAFTECLSFFHALTNLSVAICWGMTLGTASALAAFRIRKSDLEVQADFGELSKFDWFMVICIAFYLSCVGIIALTAPPNTWDSMTYHMSRVMHWIQNQSLDFYPTHIQRQLHLNPFAETVILHFQILLGGDRFANLVQFFAMTGCTIGVSLIARKLGAGFRGQLFSSVVSVTIPMGVLQGSSTQNDYVTAFWMVGFVLFFMRLRSDQRFSNIIGTGGCFGLAVLTKATAMIYAFPFFIWLGLPSLFKRRLHYWKTAGLVVIIALILNIGHLSRNYAYYGHPLGDTSHQGQTYTNNIFTAPAIVSNIIRNLSLHLTTNSIEINKKLQKWTYTLHDMMGIDPNDPRTTMFNKSFRFSKLSTYEDGAGNLHHSVLIMAAILVCVYVRNQFRGRLIVYMASVCAAFLLFCIVLKWQPWHSRLHLTLFVLAAPFCGVILSETMNQKASRVLVVILTVLSVPYVLFNPMRPMTGTRTIFNTSNIDLFFIYNTDIREPYMKGSVFAGRRLGCKSIGLITEMNDWEYPLWPLLKKEQKDVHIRHVRVHNPSRKFAPESDEPPCAIISTLSVDESEITVEGKQYSKIACFDQLCIWMAM